MPIELSQFCFTYALQQNPALTDISLSVIPGEILAVCGPSGSGKSTLLRSLKRAVTPAGEFTGSVSGLPEDSDIAIVFQNPETQLVTTTVINDLVFQMENRGMAPFTMKKRMSETVGFFGLEELLHKPVHSLSGGQKQLTALCAALMCEPKLLLLDEPVSQLDPLACNAFLETVRKINMELGVTVIMAEHRLDDCAAIADRIAFMESGKLLFIGPVKDALLFLFEQERARYVPQLPSASIMIDGRVALTPRAFKEMYPETASLQGTYKGLYEEIFYGYTKTRPPAFTKSNLNPLAALTDVAVRYPGGDFVLNRLNLTVVPGECLCIAGGNGSGKSTLLKTVAGIIKPVMGRVKVNTKRVGYMPQHVRDYFLHDRVADEIENIHDPQTQSIIARLNIAHLLNKHPFDISGGEQQKAVLAAVLSRKPELVVMDEPTKGMDPESKQILAELLRETGASVIIATHDLEFAACWADRCAMLFDGEIVYTCEPRMFFTGSRYYTTAIHKGARHIDESAMLLMDLLVVMGRE